MFPDNPLPKETFKPRMLAEKIIDLNRQLNILDGKTLADLGCTEKAIDEIINRQFVRRENLYTFPRTTTKEQLKEALIRVMNNGYGEYL